MGVEAGMVVMQRAARACFADSHLVPDLKSRMSRKDLKLMILAQRKIAGAGSHLNKKTVGCRNGSCRTAREPS
ncbi:predicted protein [Pyrenophora tritici-repentis Pt-1C-BFP]|uniref:Uncharacterized protein n=1 Tax=Pyrenophora tritici-repentis (strain Pt-1C-BFP) TaxID=426418 RepID=B2VXG4_PYRTR|nr:uncharacterized protein PTRG_03210 [Pyrenophora tritici-repentis Pt-1C-BFP]EDU45733.1 predicted protein [Pyrenophora tritici-repentis Pt-1C-BFP]